MKIQSTPDNSNSREIEKGSSHLELEENIRQ